MGFFRYALAALSITVFSSLAQAEDYPAYTSLSVNDFADVFEDGREADLAARLDALRNEHGIELTVVTIRSRDDYDPLSSIETFTTNLFNKWGVGHADRDDGLMVLVAVADRQMRIEVGAGYGPAWNRQARQIIDNIMVPNFKKGDMQGGIEAGVGTLIARVTTNIAHGFPATADPNSGGVSISGSTTHTRSNHSEGSGLSGWLWALLVPVFGVGAAFYRRLTNLIPRKCEACQTRMVLLDEVVDDSFLDDGSRFEEVLNSVNYDVWQCPSCQHTHSERWRNWLSRYGACPSCNYRAQESDTTILSSATYSSSGSKRIDYSCRHCDHSYSEIRTIPRKTKSSSSSSSSSSSFGGGSSSGGGASGSW